MLLYSPCPNIETNNDYLYVKLKQYYKRNIVNSHADYFGIQVSKTCKFHYAKCFENLMYDVTIYYDSQSNVESYEFNVYVTDAL